MKRAREMSSDQVIVMNMSGRGDKDVQQVAAILGEDSVNRMKSMTGYGRGSALDRGMGGDGSNEFSQPQVARGVGIHAARLAMAGTGDWQAGASAWPERGRIQVTVECEAVTGPPDRFDRRRSHRRGGRGIGWLRQETGPSI